MAEPQEKQGSAQSAADPAVSEHVTMAESALLHHLQQVQITTAPHLEKQDDSTLQSMLYHTLPRASDIIPHRQPFLHKLLQAQSLPSVLQQQYRQQQELQQILPNNRGPEETIQHYGQQLQAEAQQLQARMAQRQEHQPVVEPQLHGLSEQQHPSGVIIHDMSLQHQSTHIPSEALTMNLQQVSPVSSNPDLSESLASHQDLVPDLYSVQPMENHALKQESYGKQQECKLPSPIPALTNQHTNDQPQIVTPNSQQSGLDIEKLQKIELDRWRKSGTEQAKAEIDIPKSAKVALEMLEKGQETMVNTHVETESTVVPSSTKEQNAYNKNHLLSILNQTLVQFCHDNLYFVEFAHITGRFSFNLDNRETMHLVVSQMTTPPAFLDTPVPTPQPATKRKKKPPTMRTPILKESAPLGTSPRKRGRPRKVQIDKIPTMEPSLPAMLTEPALAGPSTNSLGSGRKAAVKAKQKLSLISQIKEDVNESDEDDTVATRALSDFDPQEAEDMDSDDEYIPEKTFNTSTRSPRKAKLRQAVDIDVLEAEEEEMRMEMEGELAEITIKKETTDDKGPVECDAQNNKAEEGRLAETEETIAEINPPVPDVVDHVEGDECSEDEPDSDNDEEVKDKLETAGNFPCGKCSRKFVTEREMNIHSSKHKTFYCFVEGCRNLEFYTRGAIRKHFRSEHGKGPKNLQRCRSCRHEFLTREQLKDHMTTAHSFICSVCGETFSSKVTLKKHKDSSHLEMSCTICGRNFITKAAFNRHIRRHKEKAAGKIKCDECEKEFTAPASLFHHKRAMHQGVKPYQCAECGMSFNFNNSLKLHKLKHSGVRPYNCDVCQKSYLTANHLKNHVQAVHSNHKAYECPICDKRFPYDNSLKLHMRLHTGDRPFMCSICSKTFVSRSALKVHEATHVDTKDFDCDLCNKSYKTEMLLRNHRRRHTEDGSRYMCDICGNTYMYKSNLEAHYEVHGDSRKHKCTVCGKSFKTYPTLYSHYLVHTDKNPYECNQCGKAFKTKERRKAHEVRHTGEKPFICEACGSCFPDKGGLSKHKKTVHADSPRFGCPVCGKQCNRADNLRVHMKVHGNPALLKLPQEELYVKFPQEQDETQISVATDISVTKGDQDLFEEANPLVIVTEDANKAETTTSHATLSMPKESHSISDPTTQTIHNLEAAQGLENLRLPFPVTQTVYHTQDNVRQQEVSTVQEQLVRQSNPQDVMSQMTAGAQFMGVHPWGPDGALHYQNYLLAQGYPTAGMVQAQVHTGESSDTSATYHHTTQSNNAHGQNSY